MLPLDTSVLIDVLRGSRVASDWLGTVEELPPCSELRRAEVLAGVRSAERTRTERLLGALRRVAVEEPISRRAIELARQYRRSHPCLGIVDFVIGATAEQPGPSSPPGTLATTRCSRASSRLAATELDVGLLIFNAFMRAPARTGSTRTCRSSHKASNLDDAPSQSSRVGLRWLPFNRRLRCYSWMRCPRQSIPTYFAMRRWRVSGRLASFMRQMIE